MSRNFRFSHQIPCHLKHRYRLIRHLLLPQYSLLSTPSFKRLISPTPTLHSHSLSREAPGACTAFTWTSWANQHTRDPASLGVSVLLANWTGQTGENYSIAAKNELNYLLNTAPKTSDGAISHRSENVQLWCVQLSLYLVVVSNVCLTGAILFTWSRLFWPIMA